MERCKTCNHWMLSALSIPHVCPPRWTVAFDDGSRLVVVFADDAEQAAEIWAAEDDAESGDYEIVGGKTALVHVSDSDGNRYRVLVSGESVPQYSAREVQLDDEAVA